MEIDIHCMSAAAAKRVEQYGRRRTSSGQAKANGSSVRLTYEDIKYPLGIAFWAQRQGHIEKAESIRVIRKAQGGR